MYLNADLQSIVSEHKIAFFNDAKIAFFIFDSNGCIIDCNFSFLEFTGMDKNTVLSENVFSIFQNEYNFHQNNLQKFITNIKFINRNKKIYLFYPYSLKSLSNCSIFCGICFPMQEQQKASDFNRNSDLSANSFLIRELYELSKMQTSEMKNNGDDLLYSLAKILNTESLIFCCRINDAWTGKYLNNKDIFSVDDAFPEILSFLPENAREFTELDSHTFDFPGNSEKFIYLISNRHDENYRLFLFRDTELYLDHTEVKAVLDVLQNIYREELFQKIYADNNPASDIFIAAKKDNKIASWAWSIKKEYSAKDSSEVYRLYDVNTGVLLEMENILSIIHPDDRENFKKVADEFMKGAPIKGFKYRMLQPDGTEKHIYSTGRLKYNKNNEPEIVSGIGIDITDYENKNQIIEMVNLLGDKILDFNEQAHRYKKRLKDQRLKIARDMHDLIGSGLSELVVFLKSRKTVNDEYFFLYKRLSLLLSHLRDLTFLVNQEKIKNFNLKNEIESYLERLKFSGKCEVIESIETDFSLIETEASIQILRIFQEWMTNVIRHAHPNSISVKFKMSDLHIFLGITNDGNHFTWDENAEKNGCGLSGIRERAKNIRARIRYKPGKKNNKSVFALLAKIK